MSKQLEKKAEENKQIAEANIQQTISAVHGKKELEKSFVRIGAVGAIGRLAQNLSAQTIRALQMIRDEGDYEAAGFTRFDDFLNSSEYSPMSYRQFNDREKLLMSEGDQVFDLMNSLNIPHSKRKLLGAGHVQIDQAKGTVVIVTGENLEEEVEEIELTDRSRLLQALSALADQNTVQNQKLNRQTAQIEKGSKEIDELKRKLDDAKNQPSERSFEGMHFENMMRVTNAMDAMSELVKALPENERGIYASLYLNTIRAAFARLEGAYGKNLADDAEEKFQTLAGRKTKRQATEPDEVSEIVASMNDDELAGLME